MFFKINKYYIFLLLLVQCNLLLSQVNLDIAPNYSETYKVNLHDPTSSSLVYPFDISFYVNLDVKKEDKVSRAFVYEVYTSSCIDTSGSKVSIRNLVKKNKNSKCNENVEGLSVDPLYIIPAERINKEQYLLSIPALEPNQLYDIAVICNLNKHHVKTLLSVVDQIHSNKLLQAITTYNGFYDTIELQKYYYYSPRFFTDDFNNFKQFYDSILSQTVLNIYEPQYFLEANAIKPDHYRYVAKLIQSNKLAAASFQELFFDLTNSDSLSLIVSGEREFNASFVKRTQSRLSGERLSNLRHNQNKLLKVREVLLMLKSVSNDNTIDTLFEAFESVVRVVDKNARELSKDVDSLGERIETAYSYAKWLTGTTISKTIKTRGGQRIIPDFGFVNILPYSNNSESFQYIPRPFIGFNLHLRPINRDQPFYSLQQTNFWHRSSIAFGVTIGKIDQFEFSDFYNSLSLMVGYNYRVYEEVRVGIGTAFIREESPNPIVSQNNIRPALYGSISLDFSLFEILGKSISKLIN